MKIVNEEEITTSDDSPSISLDHLIGKKAANAYHINYKNYAYGKFSIDKKSLTVFSKQLSEIEDVASRKHLYKIMYDMLELHEISGMQLFEICINQITSETRIEVLQELLNNTLPIVIRSFLPLDKYEESHN